MKELHAVARPDAIQELINAGQNTNATKINSLVQVLMTTRAKLIICLYFIFLGDTVICLFAAVGSAVDNESDTQQLMLPITIPLVFAFIISTNSIANPGSEAMIWFSHSIYFSSGHVGAGCSRKCRNGGKS